MPDAPARHAGLATLKEHYGSRVREQTNREVGPMARASTGIRSVARRRLARLRGQKIYDELSRKGRAEFYGADPFAGQSSLEALERLTPRTRRLLGRSASTLDEFLAEEEAPRRVMTSAMKKSKLRGSLRPLKPYRGESFAKKERLTPKSERYVP